MTHKRHPRGCAAKLWRFEGMDNPSAQSLTVGSLPEVRSWYTLLYDHRTRSARRKRNPRHPAHHHRVAPAELATRLLVDCQLAGTERYAAHRHCRKGRTSASKLS